MGPTRVVADGVNPASRGASNRAVDNTGMARHSMGRTGQRSHGLQLSHPPNAHEMKRTEGD